MNTLNKIKLTLLSLINNSYLFFSASIALSLFILLETDSIVVYAFKYLLMPISVFLHEASHGLMALVLNMNVIELEMRWFSGHVRSEYIVGKQEFQSSIVSFAGYAGTTLFGLLIFLASIKHKRKLLAFIIMNCVLFTWFSNDLKTLAVMLYVTTAFALCLFNLKPINYVLRFLGAYLMVSSVQSPLNQMKVNGTTDAHNLVRHYGLNEEFYIGLWMSFSFLIIALSFYLMRKQELKKTESQA